MDSRKVAPRKLSGGQFSGYRLNDHMHKVYKKDYMGFIMA